MSRRNRIRLAFDCTSEHRSRSACCWQETKLQRATEALGIFFPLASSSTCVHRRKMSELVLFPTFTSRCCWHLTWRQCTTAEAYCSRGSIRMGFCGTSSWVFVWHLLLTLGTSSQSQPSSSDRVVARHVDEKVCIIHTPTRSDRFWKKYHCTRQS